ncbi:MAG: flagellar export chaperone FliS [Terriglobales bacterium]
MDAATTYRRRAVESSTPVGLVVLMYQHAALELRHAMAALREEQAARDAQGPGAVAAIRAIERRTVCLSRVLALITELKAGLDFERGGAVARNLDHFYALSERVILRSSLQRDPQPLEDLVTQFQNIGQAWQRLDAQPAPLPASVSADPHSGPRPLSVGGRPAWQA